MTRLGKKPTRHKFFLNPYQDARFTSCPKCDGKTKLRKFPLFIHVNPLQPIVLNKTCRYCPYCDLIIAHQDEIEQQLAYLFMQQQPEMIGNDYLVIGTLDKADWRRSMKKPLTFEEMRDCLYDFKKVMSFEPARYTWVKDDSK
ncbi:MAG: hypothetical protein AB1589_15380 [Cyanobacteriota bacterium]